MKRLVLLTLFVAVACSNEEPEWRTATAENSIPALESFLVAYPDGEFADSARGQLESLRLEEAVSANTIDGFLAFLDQYPEGEHSGSAWGGLRALYRARAIEARPLTEVIYLRRSGSPRELRDADGGVIARYFNESGSWLTLDEATGDTLYATVEDSRGEPTAPRWMCLDESGTILRRDGDPVLVQPFGAESFVQRGAVMSREEYDPYGRPAIRYQTKFGCTNCAEATGNKDCVFVW